MQLRAKKNWEMDTRIIELFNDKSLIEKIQRKLNQLFSIAEYESSRAGKVGMEVGSLREKIIIAMLIYKFGESNVNSNIPITQSEIDLVLFSTPISIKTISSKRISGVKLVWTVDWDSANNFYKRYKPNSDMIYVHINWNSQGAFYYIPQTVQKQTFNNIPRSEYIKLPKQGTNPRGVEITTKAMNVLINHKNTFKIPIEWEREAIEYNPYEKWVELWKQN